MNALMGRRRFRSAEQKRKKPPEGGGFEWMVEPNIVWLDASNITWIDQPGMSAATYGPKVAFLWGNPQDQQLNGTLVKLPAGLTGEIRAHGSTFRAVVIQGQLRHNVAEATDVKILDPGSFFSSQGEAVHQVSSEAGVESYAADLSRMADVEALAKAVAERHTELDVLINNAGVFKTPQAVTPEELDVRFAVNTIAPYLLTKRLLPLLGESGRVINLSSAAQSPVAPEALAGRVRLADMEAYAQSKLALTMWSRSLALEFEGRGPAVIAVNPGSLLGTKMVKEGFGTAGKDIRIGAEILVRAALSDEFEAASGRYSDNDSGRFASPHPDALDAEKSQEVVRAIETVLARLLQ